MNARKAKQLRKIARIAAGAKTKTSYNPGRWKQVRVEGTRDETRIVEIPRTLESTCFRGLYQRMKKV